MELHHLYRAMTFLGESITDEDSALGPRRNKDLIEEMRVERVFRDVKSLLDTRPVYHQKDENIAGHVFCSFLALVLRKDLDRSLAESKHQFEWNEIKQDLLKISLTVSFRNYFFLVWF